jgi:hypothetical protein
LTACTNLFRFIVAYEPPLTDAPRPSRSPAQPPARSRTGTAWQVVAFVIGLGMLGVCVYLVASNPQYRAQIARLATAPWWLLGAVVAITLGLLASTAMVFRSTLSPIRRISILDACTINALCTLLGNLPFKLSLVVRILIHTRRHHIALPTVISWIGGTALVIIISLAPAVAATFVFKTVDARWWLATVLGTIALAIIAVLLARRLAPPDRWHALMLRMPGVIQRLAARPMVVKLHHGLATLASPSAVAQALAWRAIDLAGQTLRFWLVAQALGVEMTWAQCLIAGTTYFFLQGASPAGALGTREGGTALVLSQLAGADALAVILAVTAIESAVNVIAGVASAAYLRPDRLARAATPPTPSSPTSP